jgi:hypothetical protein
MTYEYFLRLFPYLTNEQKERARLIFERMEEGEKTPKEKRPFNFKWEGALSDLKDQYTSIELQKEISRLWSRT